MAKFIYKMQNVLNIKIQLESQAKMQFAAAQNRLNEETSRLNELKKRKENYFSEGVKLRQNNLSVLDLSANTNALSRMDEYIKNQLVQVRLAERNLESARIKLQEATVDRKTHEKLREKAFEEFTQELKHEEMKEIDELTSYTYGQKKDD